MASFEAGGRDPPESPAAISPRADQGTGLPSSGICPHGTVHRPGPRPPEPRPAGEGQRHRLRLRGPSCLIVLSRLRSPAHRPEPRSSAILPLHGATRSRLSAFLPEGELQPFPAGGATRADGEGRARARRRRAGPAGLSGSGASSRSALVAVVRGGGVRRPLDGGAVRVAVHPRP